ncbi:TRAP transporter small permease [Desertibacillus haloalkaliphilus]|uniref:TRAP transporter small permease n=1 Tax=Desertibacillus haloalkaliphilus TaxID=1328930 RepID=UPI001C2661D1|nr:TRAP transporter small permease [Desertibacillus haloalkaliphilus]MBU8907684.1 TRAP transporter small permease [Desertibacillus haloalkaliphilus]
MAEKLVDVIYNKVLANIVIIIGFIMVLTILLQIFARAFLTQPFAWTEELARLAFVWFCLLGGVITFTKKMHLGVEYFYMKFNPSFKKITNYLIYILISFFGGVLLYYGIHLVVNGWGQLSPVLRISRSYFYLPMPIAGGLFFVYSLYQLLNLIRKGELQS